nr:Na+/H+ antiporter NhaA [Rhizobium sullae]
MFQSGIHATIAGVLLALTSAGTRPSGSRCLPDHTRAASPFLQVIVRRGREGIFLATFTMSLFVGQLAFEDQAIQDRAELGILIGSCVSGIAGYLMLRFSSRRARISI